MPIAAVFTLYILSPIVTKKQHSFAINGHSYGNRRFKFEADSGGYFAAFFTAVGLGLLVLLGFVLFAMLLSFAGAGLSEAFEALSNGDFSGGSVVILLLAPLLYVATISLYAMPFIFYMARIRNLSYNNTILDDRHNFRSEIEASKYIGIILTNAMVVVLTLGLMAPWARVRLAKYVASRTTLIASGPLDVYSGEIVDEVGVASGEYVDIEGFDIGISL